MATIVATADLAHYARIGVQLSTWSVDGPETLYRVHPDQTQYPVRSLPDVSGAASFVYDYEAPLGIPVYYTALDGVTTVTSNTVTLNSTTPMLKVPGQPDFLATFELIGRPEVTRPRQRNVFYPIGRKTAVVLGGKRTAGEFTIQFETHSQTEANNLDEVLDRDVTMLLLLPNTRYPYQYVDIGDTKDAPFAEWLSLVDGDPGSWAVWSLPVITVDRPIGELYGDPTSTYDLVNTTYASYNALLAAKPTYLDILKGVP